MQRRLIAGYLLFMCSANGAYAQERIASKQIPVHVTVNARRLSGAPISNLRSSDLTVTAGGTTVSAAFSRYPASQPTFILIIVAPAAGYTSLDAIRAMLVSNLLHNDRPVYLFSMLGPKGEYLPFRSSTSLTTDLVPGEIVYKGYVQAIRDLATCKGRRAIMYLTNRLSNPPLELIAGANDAGAMIYEVGGDPRENYVYEGGSLTTFPSINSTQGTSSGPISPSPPATSNPGSAEFWENSAVENVSTVYVASSLGKAFDKLNRDLRGFYDLEINIPARTQSINLAPKIEGEYQVNAFAYSDSTKPAPVLTVSKKRGGGSIQ
jgi:hypothetical protein